MEAICEYEQQVLTAFREVEDALVNLDWQDKQLQSYKESLATAQRRAYLVQRKYNAGYANNLDLINARLTELQAHLNVVVTAGQKFQSTVQLIKALGGSWQSGEEISTEATPEEPCSPGQSEERYKRHRPYVR
jgi:multidrug efflux system outer membrane protein